MARKRPQPDHAADTRGGRWTGIPNAVIDSPAYRHLSLWARAVLVEIVRGFNGYNNGEIAVSFAQLTERLNNSNKAKISKAIVELMQHGLLDVETDGDWKQRQAREYRLTFVSTTPNDKHKSATNDYLNWSAPKKSSGNASLPRKDQSGNASLPRAKNAGHASLPRKFAEIREKAKNQQNANPVAGHASLPLIVKPYPPGQSNGPKGDDDIINQPETPAANFDDPGAFDKAVRDCIGDSWRSMGSHAKQKLADRHGVGISEIRRYLKGSANLSAAKLVAMKLDVSEIEAAQ